MIKVQLCKEAEQWLRHSRTVSLCWASPGYHLVLGSRPEILCVGVCACTCRVCTCVKVFWVWGTFVVNLANAVGKVMTPQNDLLHDMANRN